MSTHRTLLVLADSEEGEKDYRQQLQHDRSFEYRILPRQYNTSALMLSESQQIDGILLGFHLPHSNNITLLRQLKAQMGSASIQKRSSGLFGERPNDFRRFVPSNAKRDRQCRVAPGIATQPGAVSDLR